MRLVNKQLAANQRQAALLSATGSSGKQVKAKVIKVQENVFCVNCHNEYSFHYQIFCVLLCHLLLTIYLYKFTVLYKLYKFTYIKCSMPCIFTSVL